MSGLVEFLLARISDEEETAGYCFDADWRAQLWGGEFRVIDKDGDVVCVLPDDDMANQHIALHDPARVLADCAARQKIIELHRIETERESVWHDRDDGLRELAKAEVYSCVICGWVMEDGPDRTGAPGCSTLLALAAPFASHPDFDPSWGVSGG